MKRPLAEGDYQSTSAGGGDGNKKIKHDGDKGVGGEEHVMSEEADVVLMDENLLYEILRRVDDGRTLAKAACVCRQWKQTAEDERIWELICTRHSHRSPLQLRAIVSALGGFRRLYSGHLWSLLKKPAPTSSSTLAATSPWRSLPLAPAEAPGSAQTKPRWGKDEVNLSLSLLSIKYFEKMSFSKRSK